MMDFADELAALESQKPTLDEVMDALLDGAAGGGSVIPATVIYGLSDLSKREARTLSDLWRGLPAGYKAQTLRALNEASESLFELNFREIAWLALQDDDSQARLAAIDLLWFDESEATMRHLMRLSADDDSALKAGALKALGRFLLLGEYGEIDSSLADQAQQIALRLQTDMSQPVSVRRRALEALANSSHPQVERLIRDAYLDGSAELRIGAIFAMGRTCNPVWSEQLLDELAGDEGEALYEAISACGQLQLKEAVPRIAELIGSGDGDIQLAAIVALGEIGGRRALDILTKLADSADESVADAVDEALDAASFSFGLTAPERVLQGG